MVTMNVLAKTKLNINIKELKQKQTIMLVKNKEITKNLIENLLNLANFNICKFKQQFNKIKKNM